MLYEVITCPSKTVRVIVWSWLADRSFCDYAPSCPSLLSSSVFGYNSNFPLHIFLMTKYVFVTGGVVSSLGKGIAAASLGAILESRGIKITHLKLDPYINVDPGTMSPFQHGEVVITSYSIHYTKLYDALVPNRPCLSLCLYDDFWCLRASLFLALARLN